MSTGARFQAESGEFGVETLFINTTYSATVSAPGYITRSTALRWNSGSEVVTLDIIPDRPPFSLPYYQQIVRNARDSPAALQPVRRWTRPPMIYLRTVDDSGAPIDQTLLDMTALALIDTAHSFTGGRFGLAALERGTGTREGQTGWITVKWPANAAEREACGWAQVAVDGGTIHLNYKFGPGCTCGPWATRPRTVKHELGHALGFYHTESREDLMFTGSSACDQLPSERERHHAAIAYARPVGNRDVDVDPTGVPLSAPLLIVD